MSCDFQATKDEAEYKVLIFGLQIAQDLEIKILQVNVDSLLFTNQFNGVYVVKNEKITLYLKIIKNWHHSSNISTSDKYLEKITLK